MRQFRLQTSIKTYPYRFDAILHLKCLKTMFYSLHTLSKNNLTCFSGTMTCCTSYYQTQDGCLREPFLRLTFENHFFYLTVNPDFYFDNSYWILLLSFLSIVKRQKSSNQSFKKK